MANKKLGYEGGQVAGKALGEEPAHLVPSMGTSLDFQIVWRSIVEDFPPDHFRESDRVTIENFIHTWMEHRIVKTQLDREGFLVDTPQGGWKENPLNTIAHKQRALMARLARSLKITPASRFESGQVPKSPAAEKKSGRKRKSAADKMKLQLVG